MRIGLALALVAVLTFGLVGCSGTNETTAPDDQAVVEDSALQLADQITLPDGWAMDDAVSAEEVGAITGETMEYFALANSSAQNGAPSCEYKIPGENESGIRFSARVEGGADVYDVLDQYAVEGTSQDIEGLGDKAYSLELEDGDYAIVALKGDARYEIRWDPSFYSTDRDEMANALMALLLSNVYKM